MEKRYLKLQKILREMGEVVVAYSGGVDSSLLLKVAYDVLGDKAYAVLAVSPSYPSREFDRAMDLARQIGVRVEVVHTKELDDPKFSSNPENRCYFCKSELFDKIAKIAGTAGYENMVDGTNHDDINDHRPGMKALRERGVRSPLKEAGLTKEDIRILSWTLGLPTWDKDEMACLSSRFSYGEKITIEKLHMVDKMENLLRDMGFRNIRARYDKNTLKIEVDPDQVEKFFEKGTREKILQKGKDVGYNHVTVDLQGYRRGSMNESPDRWPAAPCNKETSKCIDGSGRNKKIISMVATDIIEKAKNYICLLNREGFNISRAFLYGSYVSSQAGEESDIDLMLIADGFIAKDIEKKSRAWILTRKIDPRIEPYIVSMKRFREDDTSPLLEIVRQQGVEISF